MSILFHWNEKNKHRKGAAFKGGLLAVLIGSIAVFSPGCNVPEWVPDRIADKLSGQTQRHALMENYVFSIGEEGCPAGDVRIILADYQREFSSVYGIDMWGSDAADNNTLISYIRDESLAELVDVYTMYVVAEAMDMELSSAETSGAGRAAKGYMDGLSDDEKKWLGVTESDVRDLYEKYALARDLYESVTGDISEEISDDEALVMDMRYLVTSDEADAAEQLAKLEGGMDFDGIATSYSEEDVKDIYVDRYTYDETVTEQLFALDTGEYSDVIAMDGKYYIFYCVNYFDKDLTEANKDHVLIEKREAAVAGLLDQYSELTESSLREDLWEEIMPDTSLKFEGTSFKALLEG